MSIIITGDMLLKKGACRKGVDVFEGEWPKGAEITEKNIKRAAEMRLNLYWFLKMFLPPLLWEEYKKEASALWGEYQLKVAPHLDEYKEKVKPIRKKLDDLPFSQESWEDIDCLWDEYIGEAAALWDEYKEKEIPLYREYEGGIISLTMEYCKKVR